jgi:hypothetical protein
MAYFTSEHRAFYAEYGYVRIPGVVPKENCDAVIEAMWEFTGMDRNTPEDWYRPPLTTTGMVEMYQHQAMWDNRQHPRMYEVFAEMSGIEKLWVSIDRVSMILPQTPAHPEFDRPVSIHWDIDTSNLEHIPFGWQGVLYLADTDETMGGFCCVPGFHKNLAEWVQTQPADRHPHITDLNRLPPGMKVTPIPGKAGDLVIWNSLLAHGNGPNLSDRPRLAQFIALFPAREDNEAEREERIALWRNHTHPHVPAFPGDPRGIEEKHGKTAELTPLGRKLLGLDRW